MVQQNLITELGLDNLPKEEQDELILKMGQIIQERIIIRVLDELNEKEKDEFDKLLEENLSKEGKEKGEVEIINFLKNKISNLDSIVEEEVNNFKKESIDLMKKISE